MKYGMSNGQSISKSDELTERNGRSHSENETDESTRCESSDGYSKLTDDDDDSTKRYSESPEDMNYRPSLLALDVAIKYLKKKDYSILETEYKSVLGPMDIIARDENDNLIFIQVLENDDCFPEENNSTSARKHFEDIAVSYLNDNSFEDSFVRFDIVSILFINNDKAFVRHHQNAFNI